MLDRMSSGKLSLNLNREPIERGLEKMNLGDIYGKYWSMRDKSSFFLKKMSSWDPYMEEKNIV